jgi:hypothetical protein
MPDQVPIGVLLPLRLETRFFPGKLFVRIVPDDPWFTGHDPRISAGELVALTRFVATGEVGWAQLCRDVGPARAAFLVSTYTTADTTGTRTLLPPTADQQRNNAALTRIGPFPDQLSVWLARGGSAPALAATLTVDRSRLLADFADPDDPDDLRWWEDWAEAKRAGLGVELDLPGDPTDIDVLYVSGLGSADPAVHLADLRAEGKLAVIAPGTATNTVDGAAAAPLATDPAPWLALLTATAGETEQAVSAALTGSATTLGPLPGGAEPHRAMSSALVAGLWPALWGFAVEDVWAMSDPTDPAVPRWAAAAMCPEGPYPTVRIGAQPYGLLPATALGSWTPADGDPPGEAALAGPLQTLRDEYAAAATARGTAVGATEDLLLELIGQLPTSTFFRHRPAWPLEMWWLAFGLVGAANATWPLVQRSWATRYPLPAQFGLDPARRYGARHAAGRLPYPLVVPSDLPDGTSVADLLVSLTGTAQSNPALFASTAQVDQTLPIGANSLLLRLAVRALQVAIGDLGRAKVGQSRALPEFIVRPPGAIGRLQGWIAAVTPADVTAGTPAAQRLADVVAGLTGLAGIDPDRLARLLTATVDCSAFRIDPWLVALPTRRLDTLLAAGSAAPTLGAYCWVDAPRPGAPGPTPAGLVHAPSPGQALAAAVLRDRAINDPSASRWNMQLTSRTVRGADALAEQVRTGAHLGEAAGREVERVVAVRADVDRLRARFPLRTEHAGRRTCDGLAVLGADPATLGLDATRLAGLDDLRAALDAYGDLLVAEAVHHVTEGRADVAGAVLDAAAGLARPPQLALLQTTRSGRALTTSVVLALPDAAATDPQSPAELADPAAAAFLHAQLGTAHDWTFGSLTLTDLGLLPADALSLSLTDLTRLAGSADGTGPARYERARRLVALMGRRAATPDMLAESPSGAADATDGTDAVVAELAQRYAAVRSALAALVTQLQAATAPDDQDALLRVATRWGVAPQAPPGSADPRATCVARALDLLTQRLAAQPEDGATLGLDALAKSITALVSPTGQLALTTRVPVPTLTAAPDLDTAWLPVVAAVRERLAGLEAHQLAAPTDLGGGPALTAWANKPTDPWQQDGSDGRRLVVAYAPAGLSVSGRLAVAVLDQFSEVVPAVGQTTGAAFGFDAPAARAPQAILLAVPPDLATGLPPNTLVQILAETRQLARARMARPADLPNQIHGYLPAALLPVTGSTAVPFTHTSGGGS